MAQNQFQSFQSSVFVGGEQQPGDRQLSQPMTFS
jgi:hypothetical protein